MSGFSISILFQVAALQGILLALLLVTRKRNRLANRVLAIHSFLLAAVYFFLWNNSPEFIASYPWLIYSLDVIGVLFPPLEFLYVVYLTSEKPTFKKVDLVHFIPFVFIFFFILPFYPTSAEIGPESYLPEHFQGRPLALAMDGSIAFLGLIYSWLMLQVLAKHQIKIRNLFSNIEQANLSWLRTLTLFLAACWTFAFIEFVVQTTNISIGFDFKALVYILSTVLIYLISYMALTCPQIFGGINRPNSSGVPSSEEQPSSLAVAFPINETSKYQRSGLKDEEANVYLMRLLEYMKEAKPYLQQHLNIETLARELSMPRHHLTQIINEMLNKNFFEFINDYRIEEVKARMKDPDNQQLTLLAIAYDSGFNSKASFNSVFKKHTGLTPSEYRKEAKVMKVA